MQLLIVILTFSLGVSIIINIILGLYIKKIVPLSLISSDNLSKIYAKIDAYKDHIRYFRRHTIYGHDDDVKKLKEHTTGLLTFLEKYENEMSLTNPDLLEELEEERIEDAHDSEERQEIFHFRTSKEDSGVQSIIKSKIQEQDV